jgi:dTDP-4-amino-4,6-dideoxygalactose transaminase
LKDRFAARKKEVFARMKVLGLGVQAHYIPVYRQPYYRDLGYTAGLCPQAEKFVEREISIPIYPAMTEKDVERVIDIVQQAFAENG